MSREVVGYNTGYKLVLITYHACTNKITYFENYSLKNMNIYIKEINYYYYLFRQDKHLILLY